MTPIQEYLAQVKKRCEEANSGVWRYVNEIDPNPIFLETWGPDYKTMHFVQTGGEDTLRNITPKITMMEKADAVLVAHCKQDLPKMVEALERAIEQRNYFMGQSGFRDNGLELRTERENEELRKILLGEK